MRNYSTTRQNTNTTCCTGICTKLQLATFVQLMIEKLTLSAICQINVCNGRYKLIQYGCWTAGEKEAMPLSLRVWWKEQGQNNEFSSVP